MPVAVRPVEDGRGPHPPGPASRRWLLVALIATCACVLLLALEFANLLSLPTLEGGRPSSVHVRDARGALTVAVARTPGGPGEWSNWARIIRTLSDDLEIPVTVRYLSKEDEAAAIIERDRVDLAFVCAHHYVDLADKGVCEGVCTPVIGGVTTSRAQLVVRRDDPAERVDDLAGSVFAVSDKSSLGGYAYISYLLKKRGHKTEDYFAELRLGETQEQNLHDVLSGDVRGTVINSVQCASLDLSGVRVIAESEPFGAPPVVVRADMDPQLRQQIAESLLGMDMSLILPAGSAIEGFEVLDPAEYEFARELRNACGHHAEE